MPKEQQESTANSFSLNTLLVERFLCFTPAMLDAPPTPENARGRLPHQTVLQLPLLSDYRP